MLRGMSIVADTNTGKARLMELISRRPWLLPILYIINSYGMIEYNELKQVLGVRGALLKRGLWWLVKYGVVERINDKFRVTQDYRSIVEDLLLNRCITRKYYIFRIGSTYYVAAVRRTRITVYTVPLELVEKLSILEKNVEAQFTAKDLAQALDIPAKLAYRAVKTHRLLIECINK